MSLINDALKKAQSMQMRPMSSATDTATPPPSAPSTPVTAPGIHDSPPPLPIASGKLKMKATEGGNTSPPAFPAPLGPTLAKPIPPPPFSPPTAATPVTMAAPPPAAHAKKKSPVVPIVIGAVALVVVAGGFAAGYLFLGKARTAITAAASESVDASNASTESAPASSTEEPAQGSPGAETADSLSSVASAETQVDAQTAPPPPAAPLPEPVAPPRVNNPNPAIQAWIAKVTLSGIRDGPNPKALLNSRIYEAGEIVNDQFGLKLTGIASRKLEFEDADGNTYELRF